MARSVWAEVLGQSELEPGNIGRRYGAATPWLDRRHSCAERSLPRTGHIWPPADLVCHRVIAAAVTVRTASLCAPGIPGSKSCTARPRRHRGRGAPRAMCRGTGGSGRGHRSVFGLAPSGWIGGTAGDHEAGVGSGVCGPFGRAHWSTSAASRFASGRRALGRRPPILARAPGDRGLAPARGTGSARPVWWRGSPAEPCSARRRRVRSRQRLRPGRRRSRRRRRPASIRLPPR